MIEYVEPDPDTAVLSGIFLALQKMFKAKVALRFAGCAGYDMTTMGITALLYDRRGDEKDDDDDDDNDNNFLCRDRWLDPTHDILMTARELMFRLALQGNNSDVAA
jgi:hypothetical protein